MPTDAQFRPHLGSTKNGPARRSLGEGGFTLAEVLAALLFMAILVPVTMQGVTVASRAGMLGQRKAAAMRIAERVLEEQLVSGQVATATPYGTVVDGDMSYPWSMRSDPWPEDTAIALNVLTVRVEFTVQGATFDVAVSTLYDPAITVTTSTSSPAVSVE
ncbi:PulJ/GspJ family protein [Horticoccus sp. 23ND18S-11]|uniref:PulJ/GspJ family protein n=1 Tax=Horticoccus sp. 23ND18S-11 TaxID=3391832 RepID=UPI0039C99377